MSDAGRRWTIRTVPARALLIAAAGLLLVAVIVLIPRPGNDDTSTPGSTTTVAERDADLTVTPVDGARTLADVTGAIQAILDADGVVLRARSDLDGLIETFDVELDAVAPSFRSLGTIGNVDGVDATFEKIETPDTTYIRVIDPGAETPSMWSVIPIETPEQSEWSSAYTAFGRITPDLHDLLTMIEDITVRTEVIDDGTRRGYRLTARADEVSRYLRENGLAAMAPTDEIGATVWDVWIDGGQMTQLVASGVQFFTGEPFRNALVEVDYQLAAVAVSAPDVDDTTS